MGRAMFDELIISDVRPEGAGAVAVSFAVPQDLGGRFAFRPGQYLTLRAMVNGQDMRRSYSIAALPGGPLTVGIKRVEGGAFSTFAQGLRPGDRLQVMPPAGRFICRDEVRIVLIAAGSGITPMVAIAADALARGAEVSLIYGNRSRDTIMFRAVLGALKDRHVDRFTLIHVLSREVQDVPLLNGRVDADKLAQLAHRGVVDMAGADGVFLCGPGAMIDEVAARLPDLGVAAGRVHQERFFTADTGPRPARSSAAEGGVATGAEVALLLDGTTRHIRVEATDATILEAAERQGIALPYSCRGGMCCTCRCRVSEGSVEMATNYSLETWELQAGFVLACQARPTSARITLDFDAV